MAHEQNPTSYGSNPGYPATTFGPGEWIKAFIDKVIAYINELEAIYAAKFLPDVNDNPLPPKPVHKKYGKIMSTLMKKQKTSSTSSTHTSSSSCDYMTFKDYNHPKINASTYGDGEQGPQSVLIWWRKASTSFPILSRIARDILATPVSTVASESAFSAGRRVLDEKRSRLAPESIRMCVMKKDWDQAEKRCQGYKDSTEDDEFEELFRIETSGSESSQSSPGGGSGSGEDSNYTGYPSQYPYGAMIWPPLF